MYVSVSYAHHITSHHITSSKHIHTNNHFHNWITRVGQPSRTPSSSKFLVSAKSYTILEYRYFLRLLLHSNKALALPFIFYLWSEHTVFFAYLDASTTFCFRIFSYIPLEYINSVFNFSQLSLYDFCDSQIVHFPIISNFEFKYLYYTIHTRKIKLSWYSIE